MFLLATGSRATLFEDRLAHSYCGFGCALALEEIKTVQIYFEGNSFVLMLNNSTKHRLLLAHWSEASVARFLQLLRQRTPSAHWNTLAQEWSEGKVKG